MVPAPVRASVKEFGNRLQTLRARQRFEGARLASRPLDIRALDILQRRYRVAAVNYDYSPDDRLARGQERFGKQSWRMRRAPGIRSRSGRRTR